MRIDTSFSAPLDEREQVRAFNQRHSLLLQGHRNVAVTFLSPVLLLLDQLRDLLWRAGKGLARVVVLELMFWGCL